MREASYEVYACHAGRWSLEYVASTETDARARATGIEKKSEGVRVIRSIPLPDGTARESVLIERMRAATTTIMGAGPATGGLSLGDIEEAPYCRTLEEYFALDSRITVRRLMWRQLDEMGVTPIEVLYSPQHIRDIMKGSLAPMAIERVAELQGRAAGEDQGIRKDAIRAAIKQIHAKAKVWVDQLPNSLPAGAGFATIVAEVGKVAKPADRNHLVMAAATRSLRQVPNLTEKLARAIAWARDLDGPDLSLVDDMIADLMGSATLVQELLGAQTNLAANIVGMIDLALGKLEAPGRNAVEVTQNLCALFARDKLPEARSVLFERINKNLRSPQPLTRGEGGNEGDGFQTILDRVVTPDGLVGDAAMADSLVQRAVRVRRLSGPTAIGMGIGVLMRSVPDGLRRAQILAALAASDLSRTNMQDIMRAVNIDLASVRDVGALTPGSMAPKDRLRLVTSIHAVFEKAPLPDRVREAVRSRMDQIMAEYLINEKIIEKLDRAEDPLRLRATRLLQFCASGLLIEGRSSDITRHRILQHLRQPRFTENLVADLADPGQRAQVLREFHQLMTKAGMDQVTVAALQAGRNAPAPVFVVPQSAPPPPPAAAATEMIAATQMVTMPIGSSTELAVPGIFQPGEAQPAPAAAATPRRRGPQPPSDRCLSCFQPIEPQSRCAGCGWDPAAPPRPSLYLNPGDVLSRRYFVGRLLGCGGFGATYMGWDEKLRVRVAIKEYYPSSLASRAEDGHSLRPHADDAADQFYFGMERFLDEARILAQFRAAAEIISVLDYFEENETAYIVMEYVEGKPLNNHLKEKGGKISVAECLKLVLPVIEALDAVHRQSVIHRDISPDNIYLASDGNVKLLDFGAARHAVGDQTGSMTVVLKRGFAPAEQYSNTGKQGPWTDVYGLCATIYRAITGQPPVEAVSRWEEDGLVPPSTMGIAIPPHVEAAILKGLSLRWQERTQNMFDLKKDLAGS